MAEALRNATEPTPYERIAVKCVAGALGAEIEGADLARLDDATFAEIHRAFLDHQVIFFRGQDMTPEQYLAFAKRWGGIHFYPYMKGLDSHPEIFELVKTEDATPVFGNRWHSDQMYTPIPAKATMLYAKDLPPAGGDTMFSNLYLAYDALSDGMKRMLSRLKTYNDGDNKQRYGGKSRAEWYGTAGMGGKLHAVQDNPVVAEHPLIRTHPETGRKALFIGDQSRRFVDMTDEESKPLIAYLMAHATRPEFTCRFRWKAPGALALWDNRCCMHYAVADYAGKRRVMHRITIKGDEAPF
jgi:taurine dioxygenase